MQQKSIIRSIMVTFWIETSVEGYFGWKPPCGKQYPQEYIDFSTFFNSYSSKTNSNFRSPKNACKNVKF